MLAAHPVVRGRHDEERQTCLQRGVEHLLVLWLGVAVENERDPVGVGRLEEVGEIVGMADDRHAEHGLMELAPVHRHDRHEIVHL